ncbi:MAG: hypothetical protein JW982_16230 [Spirochaetes bacterium]|nr:hypothetical protein [Spirochaetota bacterium]
MSAIKNSSRTLSFEEYKMLKDEIISAGKKEYDEKLSAHLNEFRSSVVDEIGRKFSVVENDLEIIEKRIMFVTWFVPVIICAVFIAFQIISR